MLSPLMLTVAPAYGYVLAAAVGSWGVHHVYGSLAVGQARKKYNIKYPAMYADEKNCANEQHRNIFNCTQRAHQNCLENQPTFLSLLLTAGVFYPVTAAASGLVYLVGKVMYINGYSSGVPDKRMQGAISYIGLLTLMGCVIRAAATLISSV
ncbi:MAG: hypothetical protein WDW38_003446 [Sanguina aurantia]